MPRVTNVKRQNGIAGQYAYAGTVVWDEDPTPYGFQLVGSTYGGPIVSISDSGTQVFVSPSVMERCGPILNADWVRAYFE